MLKHRSKFMVLLTPSLLSIVISVFLSLGIMLAFGLTYLAGRGVLYNFVFGQGSSADLIATSRNTLEALNNTVLGNAWLNKVLYFAFWMVVGLCVYIILFAILRGTGAATEGIKEASYANIKRSKLLENFAIRFSVRVAAIFAWIEFTIIFFKVLLPFCGLVARTASLKIISLNSLSYSLTGFVILMLSFHIEVVLLRLVALRVRLFSQEEVSTV